MLQRMREGAIGDCWWLPEPIVDYPSRLVPIRTLTFSRYSTMDEADVLGKPKNGTLEEEYPFWLESLGGNTKHERI